MKYVSIIASLIVVLLFSCQNNGKELINEYYEGLNESDFNKISSVIADTFTTADGDWVVKYSNIEYYDWFAWDSVFEPFYLIKDFVMLDSGMIFTVSKKCKRIDFLHGSNLDFKVRAIIKDNKIKSINTENYINMDFEKWGNTRDSLLNWIDKEHPGLSGFMNKQNSVFANKYLKAIQLYSNRN